MYCRELGKLEPRMDSTIMELDYINGFWMIIKIYWIPIEQFRSAVDVITGKDYNTKILLGFLHREEKRLLEAFSPYNLRPTKFPLEYASIKPSK